MKIAFKRLSLLIEKIKLNTYVQLEDLDKFLKNHDLDFSIRTLQRDIQTLRNEFGIELSYDRSRNAYYIDKENSIDYDAFVKLIELTATSDFLIQSLKEGKTALQHISFDALAHLEGHHQLLPLFQAIKNRRVVKFTHLNYFTDKETQIEIKPLHLKEYLQRWYVIGQLVDSDKIRTYGIDRISELTTTETVFPPTTIDTKQLFDDVIGLVYSDNTLQTIKLWFEPLQAKYIKSLKWHHSQQIVEENERGLTITLRVKPNYELIQKILMLGANVKVLAPVSLQKDIKKELQKAVGLYGK